jgi:hypothetical protein
MLRLALSSLALLLASAPAAAEERNLPIADFDRIVVEGPFTVRLSRANTTRAVVSGARGSVDGVTVEVQGQTLRVRRNPSAWGGNPGVRAAPAEVTLSGRVLRSARLVGTGSLDIQGVEGQRLDLSVEGSGRIRAAGLRVDRVAAGLRGAGSIILAGAAEQLSAEIHGGGAFDARALQVEDATVTAATTGAVVLNVRRTVTVAASGLGAVEVEGPAACTLRGPTASNVRCRVAR